MAGCVVAVFFGACGTSPPRATVVPPARAPRVCRYDVEVHAGAKLAVKATCDVPVQSFIASESVMAAAVRVDDDTIQREGARFVLPPDAHSMSYRIDLGAVAREHTNIDVAYEARGPRGVAWIAAVSTWILRPHPITSSTRVEISVSADDGVPFATAMPPVGDHYELLARQIRFATYSVFGTFTSEELSAPGPFALASDRPAEPATIQLVTLPGALDSDAATRRAWVGDTAKAVGEFWQGFPMSRALVVLIPVANHAGIQHGKVVATGGAGVAIHIGEKAQRADLYGDWILVHELFHLGFPSFSREGKWLDEGLATYFEPIIRARAGWLSPHAVWKELAVGLPQGLPAVEGSGVENATDFQGIYWGGAIIALLADVATRQRTNGKLGLEDGLRAVLAAGGDASHLWKLDRVVSVIDEHLGAPTLRDLTHAHSLDGRPVDLDKLWADLGVSLRGPDVVLDPDAALAAVREAILAPPPPSR